MSGGSDLEVLPVSARSATPVTYAVQAACSSALALTHRAKSDLPVSKLVTVTSCGIIIAIIIVAIIASPTCCLDARIAGCPTIGKPLLPPAHPQRARIDHGVDQRLVARDVALEHQHREPVDQCPGAHR